MVVSVARAEWASPPKHVALSPGEVHVWLAELDGDPYESEQIARFLAPDEHEGTARIRLPRDRQRWMVARGTLRMLLGRYLDTNPRLVELGSGPQGKPVLGSPGDLDLRFNLSHSDDLALYALALGRDVGVDLEHCRPDVDEMPVAERLFTIEETAFIATHGGEDRYRAFLRCWTAKEAYLKARGLGRTTAARNHVRIVRDNEIIVPRNWDVSSMTPTWDTVAALAVHGDAPRVHLYRWHSPFRPS